MRRWAILNTILGVIVLLLGLQIAWTWARTLPVVDFSARPAETSLPRSEGKEGGGREGKRGKRGAAEKQPPPTPAAMVASIVNKDLFDPSRQKPSEETKPPPPKETPPPPNLTVVGVRILGRDREAFVIEGAAGGQQKRLRVGDRLGEYTIKTIEPRRIVLSSPTGEPVKVALTVDKSAPAATMPKPGIPPRPGQPPQVVASPAAGVQPPVPPIPGQPIPGQPGGVQPRPPRPAAGKGPVPVTSTTLPPGMAPQLPASVRERLEQLKTQ